jgi:hypothetical protein
MTGPNRPPRRTDQTGPGRAHAGRVEAVHLRPRARGSEVDWGFVAEVGWIGGAEGEWLRGELAAVVRDLLLWARDDQLRLPARDGVIGSERHDRG